MDQSLDTAPTTPSDPHWDQLLASRPRIANSLYHLTTPEGAAILRSLMEAVQADGAAIAHPGDAERFNEILNGSRMECGHPRDRSLMRRLDHLVEAYREGKLSTAGSAAKEQFDNLAGDINFVRAELIREELIPHDARILRALISRWDLFSDDEIAKSKLAPGLERALSASSSMMKLRHTLYLASFIDQAIEAGMNWNDIRSLTRWVIAGRLNDRGLWCESDHKSFTEWAGIFERRLGETQRWWMEPLVRLFGMAGGMLKDFDLPALERAASLSSHSEEQLKALEEQADPNRRRKALIISTEHALDENQRARIEAMFRSLGLPCAKLIEMTNQSSSGHLYVLEYVPVSLEELSKAHFKLPGGEHGVRQNGRDDERRSATAA